MEFFLGSLLIGITLVILQKRWLGVSILVFTFFVMLVSSSPLVSEKFALFLSVRSSDISSINQVNEPLAIVVLDSSTIRYEYANARIERPSDNGLCRAMVAANIFQSVKNPIIVISGGAYEKKGPHWSPEGSAILDLLVSLNIPRKKIFLDSESRNTYEHAINISPMLKALNVKDFVLITSSTHMLRAIKTFKNQGLVPFAAFSAERCLVKNIDIWPNLHSLTFMQEVLHEYFGLFYYRMNGWL